MKRYFNYIVLILLFSFTLAACANNDAQEYNYQMAVPTPAPGQAVIIGRFLDADTNEPILGVPYLARSLTEEDSTLPPTISFSYQNNQSATYDEETGEFYFANVTPDNEYAIILIFGPGNTKIVKEADNQSPILIELKAGEVIDLGTLKIKE